MNFNSFFYQNTIRHPVQTIFSRQNFPAVHFQIMCRYRLSIHFLPFSCPFSSFSHNYYSVSAISRHRFNHKISIQFIPVVFFHPRHRLKFYQHFRHPHPRLGQNPFCFPFTVGYQSPFYRISSQIHLISLIYCQKLSVLF